MISYFFIIRKLILDKYIKNYLLWDTLVYAIFLMNFIHPVNNNIIKYGSMGIFFKIPVYTKNFKFIEENINLIGNKYHLWQLIILLKKYLAVCHIIGITYYLIGYLE